jgi:hypothetical protein
LVKCGLHFYAGFYFLGPCTIHLKKALTFFSTFPNFMLKCVNDKVMKEYFNKFRYFVTFESPLAFRNIQKAFERLHQQQSSLYPQWSSQATRQKMIATYWFYQVVPHFLMLLGLSAVIVGVLSGSLNNAFALAIFAVSIVVFITLLLFYYLPAYTSEFLPRLESVAAAYKVQAVRETAAEELQRFRKQFRAELKERDQQIETQQRLIREQEAQQAELSRCRQQQLPNFSLALIYYALSASGGATLPPVTKETAITLCRLYGVDPGSLRVSLQQIATAGRKDKRAGGTRGETELRNRFTEAEQFLQAMNCQQATRMLHQLETKFFQQ